MAGIYEFKPDDAFGIATANSWRVKQNASELQVRICPYCNGGSHQDKYTFSISLTSGAFNCKRGSCGAHGSFVQLARDFSYSLGRDADEYHGITWRRFRNIDKPMTAEDVRPGAVKYLEGRGISQAVTERYLITTRTDDEKILVFPFKNPDGQIEFVKYRNTAFRKGDPGSKEFCEPDCRPILFGMYQCDLENKTLIMTEGQIDSLSVAEAGIQNAVSVPTGKNGFTWLPHCWDWLGHFDTLIIFGDHENGQITLLEEMKARFNGVVKHVRPEDYRGCKDANEILQKHGPEAIRECIANAEQEQDPHIMQLCEVTSTDLSKMEGISTGLPELDRIIGGLYFGHLVVLTGERGTGKSTLASQMMAQALRHGYASMAYSGELPKGMYKSWLDRQLSGGDGLEEFTTPTGKQDWRLAKWKEGELGRWYKNLAFIYDARAGYEEEEAVTVTGTIEKAAKQYGIRVFLVDNLMTALSDANVSTDLNRLQTALVTKLCTIAREYNVLILLVAHPRKSSGASSGMRNDDVMGSGNITNAASVVIEYKRAPEMFDHPDRMIRVLKNRLTGDVHSEDEKGISAWFQPETKRITDTKDDFTWPTDGKQMTPVYDEQIPF